MLIPVQNAYFSLYFIKIWPFKPCTLTKHVIWISLYPNFPVKTLYFPVRDCSASCIYTILDYNYIWQILTFSRFRRHLTIDTTLHCTTQIIYTRHYYSYLPPDSWPQDETSPKITENTNNLFKIMFDMTFDATVDYDNLRVTK